MSPDTIKAGDDSGNGMVVKYVPADGPVVYGIGVPQGWSTPLGPTWCYVVEGDVLTLIDTGCHGGAGYLEEGLEHIGYSLGAVGRVVITHGHIDHDGGCLDVLARSGAELWAHEVYGSLVGVGRSSREVEVRKRFSGFVPLEDEVLVHQIKKYEEMGRQVKVTKLITDGLSSQGLRFYYTPGHSPDELCILYQRVLFTGDHILPGVTPHPSIGLSYNSFRDALPDGYRTDNGYFGLKVYLRSLKAVSGLGEEVTVLPAHRAFHKGKFNLVGLHRAGEIVEHHRERCGDLIGLLRQGTLDLETITRRLFFRLMLDGRNFHLAFTEVISHVELLQESGDVAMVGDGGMLVQWNGTENYSRFIDEL